MDTNRWFWNDSLNNLFLLLIVFNRLKEAELYVVGPYRQEMLFDSILLNDEIRDLDDKVIDCLYVDHSWIFHKVRNDRKHPNGRQTVESNFITTVKFVCCLVIFIYCTKWERDKQRRILFRFLVFHSRQNARVGGSSSHSSSSSHFFWRIQGTRLNYNIVCIIIS